MKAQIITIGDELLIGQTVDTNSAWMGAELSKIGFDVTRITSVHDRHDDIIEMLQSVTGNTEVVLITGGLGPTSDDITKHTLCEFFNSRLVVNSQVLQMVEALMKKRGLPMNENNRRQAEVPDSCKVLTNAAGTAPGMWFEKANTVFISMPGVPVEMKYIMNQHAIPELKRKFGSQVIIHKNIMTYGTSEAKLAEILTGFEETLPSQIKLAYLPSYGINKLRLTATGTEPSEIHALIIEQVRKLNSLIPDLIFAEDETSFEEVIGRLLRERRMTLSTAESCTGGRIAGMITSVPGSSDYFMGSVIAYNNDIKKKLLGVDNKLLNGYGAVSSEVVAAMSEGARRLMCTDYSLATTGIAGPDGGSESKPVGTIWIAVNSRRGTFTEKHVFGGDRNTNITRFSIAALNMLRKQIIS